MKYYKIYYPKNEYDLVCEPIEQKPLVHKNETLASAGVTEGQVIKCVVLATTEHSLGDKPDVVFFSLDVWKKRIPVAKKELPLYIEHATSELSKLLSK